MIILLLAVVFVLAAFAKLFDRAGFRAVLEQLLPRGWEELLTVMIPALEMALAGLLLSGVFLRQALACAIALLAIFTLALGWMWKRGIKGCGCFGEIETKPGTGLARNLILVSLAGYTYGQSPLLPVFRTDSITLLGQLTVVVGLLCLWPCVVVLIERRAFLFPASKP